MNKEFIEEMIRYTISGESHLGTNLKEQCLMYFDNLISENQQLKEKIEASEKTRKEAIKFMKNCEFDKTDKYIAIGEYQEYKDLLQILDIDKGE